jgi:hypothetical protein
MVYDGCWLNNSVTAVTKACEIVPCRLTDVVNYPPQPENMNIPSIKVYVQIYTVEQKAHYDLSLLSFSSQALEITRSRPRP